MPTTAAATVAATTAAVTASKFQDTFPAKGDHSERRDNLAAPDF